MVAYIIAVCMSMVSTRLVAYIIPVCMSMGYQHLWWHTSYRCVHVYQGNQRTLWWRFMAVVCL
jgi:16S rRNA U1498 N3-methylase RsmE